jgi:hypothetical protein
MKINPIKAVFAVAGLALMTLACSLFSSAPSLPGISGNTGSLLTDDFSDTGSGWGTGTDSNSSVEYAKGGLEMIGFKDNFISWSNPNSETYQDVHMEATVKNDSGDTRVGFGFICNQQVTTSAYNFFAVSTDGEYVIGRAAVAREDFYLTNNNDWGTSSLIAQNASSYRIAADCAKGHLTLYVDGNMIDSAVESTYSDGGVALFLWTGDEPSGDITYDNFVMTSLK